MRERFEWAWMYFETGLKIIFNRNSLKAVPKDSWVILFGKQYRIQIGWALVKTGLKILVQGSKANPFLQKMNDPLDKPRLMCHN